jgi:hypothetical protein
MAAQYQQETGLPAFDLLLQGHSHTAIGEGGPLSTPSFINSIIGFPADDRSLSEARVSALMNAFIDGSFDIVGTGAPAYKRQMGEYGVDTDYNRVQAGLESGRLAVSNPAYGGTSSRGRDESVPVEAARTGARMAARQRT